MRHPIRKIIGGMSMINDSLHLVKQEGALIGAFAEYNDEVTGCTPSLGPYFGGQPRTRWLIKRLQDCGFIVEHCDDRNYQEEETSAVKVKATIVEPESPCVNDRKYPYIGKCGDTVVFFYTKGAGVCLAVDSSPGAVGNNRHDWREHEFGYLYGSITLENQF